MCSNIDFICIVQPILSFTDLWCSHINFHNKVQRCSVCVDALKYLFKAKQPEIWKLLIYSEDSIFWIKRGRVRSLDVEKKKQYKCGYSELKPTINISICTAILLSLIEIILHNPYLLCSIAIPSDKQVFKLTALL